MPESIRVSSGALTGPPPGVVSRNSVMSIRVICPMVAELAVKIGRSRGAEGDAGLKRLVILSAMKRWLPHPGSGHATVDGTAGGLALVQVCSCDQIFSLRRFDASRQ